MSEVAEKGTFTQGGPRFYLSRGDGAYRRMYDRLVIKNLREVIEMLLQDGDPKLESEFVGLQTIQVA